MGDIFKAKDEVWALENPQIFKAYDIRGIYHSEINEEIVYKIGRAFAELLQEDQPKKKLKIVVSRDMRLSSPQLSASLIKGLTDQGADVIDIGLAATPTFYFTVGNYNYDGGIQVSASHNPKEYTGLKFVRQHVQPVGIESGLAIIKEKVQKNAFRNATKGTIEEKQDILKAHVQHDLSYIKKQKVQPFKIVADPANAMGIIYIEELFKQLPCTLVKMNFTLDGTFPTHLADPLQDTTLTDLKQRVLKEKADLGVATDGDGDRIFFVDNNGETIPQPIIRGLMAQIFLKQHPKAKVCYDIRPGKITEEMIRDAGGIPIVTRVGHSYIKAQMIKEDAIFAGESSGHFFVKMASGSYEAPMIILLKLLALMSEHNKPIAEIIKPYKKYVNSGEINIEVEDKDAKIQKIAKHYKHGKINNLDGISVEFADFWFNVRKSNTEPLLRITVEATSKKIVEEKVKELLGLINK